MSWFRVNDDDLNRYKSEVDIELRRISFDHDVFHCTNRMCKETDHINYIAETYKEAIMCCLRSSEKYLPMNGNKNGFKTIPGWNDRVKIHQETSLFWHDIWIQNGKPKNGIVANIMRSTRAKYHYAIRMAIRDSDLIRSERMSEAIANGNNRNLWSEVRKMKNTCRTFPNSIDGINGKDNIAKSFSNKFSKLYNDVGYDDKEMSNLNDEVTILIQNDDSCNSCHAVTIAQLVEAMEKLKMEKSESSGLFSNHIIYGGKRLHVILTLLFNAMLSHGFAPQEMLTGTMIPLQKNKRESRNISENYRAITLGTVIGKLYDIVILQMQASIFKTSSLQFGFKENGSTTLCTFSVNEIISYYVSQKSTVYSVMLDASKAFDRVNYCKLFRKLINRKMCPLFIRLLIHMYTNQKLNVNWNGSLSADFKVSNGVRQGGILSPMLFGIYIDGLLTKLQNNGIGCHIGQIFLGSFGYADDVILLCPSLFGIKKMIKICEDYANSFDILFNGKKSKLLIFNKKTDVLCNITVNGECVPECNEAIYLGHKLSTIDESEMIFEEVKNFNVRVNMFLANFSSLKSGLKNKLFKQFCCVMYGSPLWNLNSDATRSVCVSWRKSLRRIWRIPFNAHCDIVSLISNEIPMELVLLFRFYTFFKNVINSENQVIKTISEAALQNVRSTFGNNVRKIMSMLETNATDLSMLSLEEFKRIKINQWLESVKPEYFIYYDIIMEVIEMRDKNDYDILNNHECNLLIKELCTCS